MFSIYNPWTVWRQQCLTALFVTFAPSRSELSSIPSSAFTLGKELSLLDPSLDLGSRTTLRLRLPGETSKASNINERDQENLAGESEVSNLPLVLETVKAQCYWKVRVISRLDSTEAASFALLVPRGPKSPPYLENFAASSSKSSWQAAEPWTLTVALHPNAAVLPHRKCQHRNEMSEILHRRWLKQLTGMLR